MNYNSSAAKDISQEDFLQYSLPFTVKDVWGPRISPDFELDTHKRVLVGKIEIKSHENDVCSNCDKGKLSLKLRKTLKEIFGEEVLLDENKQLDMSLFDIMEMGRVSRTNGNQWPMYAIKCAKYSPEK